MLVKDVLTKTTQFFRDKGFESPRLDTELLIASALDWERMKLYLNYEHTLSDHELSACRDFVRRRANGEPVAYILGYKDFYKHRFAVSPAVLVPRPETELLVEQALEWLATQEGELRVVDLGTGSGCIGLSIAAENPQTRVLCVDLSESALAIARANAATLNGSSNRKDLPPADVARLEGIDQRLSFLRADAARLTTDEVATSFGEPSLLTVDAVVANPPYIDFADPQVQDSVRKFEPEEALFAGEQGLAAIRAWTETAERLLRPGGFVMFEIGHGQAEAARKIFADLGTFNKIETVYDLASLERFVKCFKREEN